MKKMLLGAFLGIFAVAGIAFLPNYANADGSGSSNGASFDKKSDDSGIGGWDKQTTDYNANVRGSSDFERDNLIQTIRSAINWVLGILSFIALCLCLWGGFQMMTSGGDSKKYESGLNILKWAAIGLAVIAVSWLIVSLVFYVINGSMGDNSVGEGNGGNNANLTQ